MKYCSHCGKEIFDEAVVCPNCGCIVNGKKMKKRNVHKCNDFLCLLKAKKEIVLVACAAVLLLIISVTVLNNKNIFDNISSGMSMEEVHSRLGEPDEVSDSRYNEYDIYNDVKFAGIQGALKIYYEYGSVDFVSWNVENPEDLDSNEYRKTVEKIKKKLNKISGLGEPSESEDNYSYVWEIPPNRYVLLTESDHLSVVYG